MSALVTTPTIVTIAAPGPQGPPGAGGAGQVRISGTAAAALSGHRVVTRGLSDTLDYASSSVAGHLHAPMWITLGAAAAGAVVDTLAYGTLTESSWSWTPGPLYLGLSGLITQVPPAAPSSMFLAQIGYATSTTSVLIVRHPSILLI